VLKGQKPLSTSRPYGCYVMENILFKASYPAEFHAQTAVEAAMQLRACVINKCGGDGQKIVRDIEKVVIETTEAGVRIIDKKGPLRNPADRDHCIRYMVAVPLLFGRLVPGDYQDDVASDPCIDALRSKMYVVENHDLTRDYYDPDKRYIGNAVQVYFRDGTCTDRIRIDAPIGHRTRREEPVPELQRKFRNNLVSTELSAGQEERLIEIFASDNQQARLESLPVSEFMSCLVPEI